MTEFELLQTARQVNAYGKVASRRPRRTPAAAILIGRAYRGAGRKETGSQAGSAPSGTRSRCAGAVMAMHAHGTYALLRESCEGRLEIAISSGIHNKEL
jgi:hypothetical protein